MIILWLCGSLNNKQNQFREWQDIRGKLFKFAILQMDFILPQLHLINLLNYGKEKLANLLFLLEVMLLLFIKSAGLLIVGCFVQDLKIVP